jgi:ABC-type sugar transport system ATPase subunit
MTSVDLLNAEGITKRFPGVVALDEVDFNLRSGEIHAILGENGAGKSTLIKIFGGVHECDSGKILMEGKETLFRDPDEAQRNGVRVIHQELNLLPLLSVAENIFLGNLPSGFIPGSVAWRRMNSRAKELLGKLEVELDPKTLVGHLTAAEKQLVEITQALTTEMNILIMDEPTAALNDSEVETLFELLKAMTRDGIGIIYITHRISEVFQIADRVTVLRDGILVGTQEVAQANPDELVKMMVGRSLDEMYPRDRIEPGEVILEARDLCSEEGLNDVSLELREREILGVYGLLGSGRSRLARTLFGAEPISSGELRVRGQNVRLRSPYEARRMGMGYIPIDRKAEGLIMPLSMRKNVTLANLENYLWGPFLNEKKEKQSAESLKSNLQIHTPTVESLISGLSGGNQQKVVVARWLDADANLLIMNEPTRGIDVGAKVEIYTLMDRLCHEGTGILMFSSEMPELLAIADRIIVMSNGRITGEFSHGEATQEKLMSCAVA